MNPRVYPPIKYPIREDITVLPADDVCYIPQAVVDSLKELGIPIPHRTRLLPRLGWIIYEEVGIVVINDYDINRISVGGSRTKWQRCYKWFRDLFS